MTRNELRRALKAARDRATKAEAQARDVPAELELLRQQAKSNARRARLDTAVEAIIVQTVKDELRDWNGSLTLPPPVKILRADEECVALAHPTDTQIGKITDTYNTEIAEGRCMEYARAVASACRKHYKSHGIRELHVYFGGDMVEGELIFPHQPHQIDSSVYQQACVNAPKIMAGMVLYWSRYFDKIVVKCVSGNHGRPASKHAGSHPQTNWDRVSYTVMKLMVELGLQKTKSKCAVDIEIAQGWYCVDNILGHRNLLIHGDQGIRGFGGFPWYGVGKKVAGWLDAVREPWDNLFFGHFHQYVHFVLNGHRIYCGGTTESDNEYARAELAATGAPVQRFMIWTRKQPVVDCPIELTYGYTPRIPYSQKRRVTL
jgi:hypothetical protein